MAVPRLFSTEDTIDLRNHCDRRLAALEIRRQPWLDFARAVAAELLPHKLPYIEDAGNTTARGGQRNDKIVDSVGHLALATTTAGITQGLMPPSSPWFDLSLRGWSIADDPVREFLQESARNMRQMHNQSNANQVLPEAQMEWIAFGTAAALIIEDDEEDYRLDALSVGEYCIADDARGRPDTLYRLLSMTVAQLEEEFGLEALSQSSRMAFERGDFDTPVECIHAIEPDRDGLNPLGRDPEMPWRSVYYERQSDAKSGVLGIRGFRRFPALVWRYSRIPGSAYGHGRGHDALPHLTRLTRMIVRYGEAVAHLSNPGLQLPPGMHHHEVRMLPGANAILKSPDQEIKNLRKIDLRLAELAEEMVRARNDIRDTLGATLVASLRRIDRTMTARETDLRTSQDLTEWLPALYRQNAELMSPYVEWIWDIAADRGRLPEMPPELLDQVIDIEFTSPLARKQDEAEVDAMVETLAIGGEVAKLRQDVVDNFDFDEIMRRISAIKGAPAKALFARDQVQEMRQARAQQQAAEARAMAAQQGADVALTAAQAQAQAVA